jgi:outer membrane protein assembly factor BamB
LDRFWTRRWPIALAMLAVLLLGTSGCAGGSVQAASWTGLTAVGDTLYAADLEQTVALNAEDAELLWAFPMDPAEDRRGTFYVTPAVDDEYVIVASKVPPAGFLSHARNVVWALERENGRLLWSFDDAEGQYIEGGAIGGGLFVIGNSDGNVYALDVESGALRWTFPTGHRVWATPLITEDTVYIGSMDRHLYALRLSDGKEVWHFPSDGDVASGAFASAPVLQDGTLYLGAFDDHFYAIDADTGAERWRFMGANWFWGSPTAHGDAIYAADVDGNVYAINAQTGEQIWIQALGSPIRAGLTLSEDGSMLFVGSQDGTLHALDTADGFELWPRESEGQLLSTPVVNGSVVYEPLLYGPYRIRALYVDNGREVWTYAPATEK